MARPRVLVIGLDCAPPALVFDRWRESMPHLAGLMDRGQWGPLRSTIPPITVPAWGCMVSGRDPGELGLYGFRNRTPHDYGLRTASARDVQAKRLWDLLGEAGYRVAPLFVPLTYPPSPVRGQMVSCFMTPGPDCRWTFPPSLSTELEQHFGPYQPDVHEYRSEDRERILGELHETAAQHFAMARYVWTEKSPDFLMMVEMGPDRLHHAMWHCLDPTDPRYIAGNPWEERARAYYARLDEEIGTLLEHTDEDTTVLVVSDHGARPMHGGVRINEWLRREGWLSLRDRPDEPTPLAHASVDWPRTRAWGEGGYYARIFLNVQGREPQGAIAPAEYDRERDTLAHALEAMTGPDGQPLGNRVIRPEDTYREIRGTPPDLMVFWGDLAWRSLGTVGGEEGVYTPLNDTGPDACNHDWDGIFIMAGRAAPRAGRVEGLQIYDVARTVLGALGARAPTGMLGQDRSLGRQEQS
jgi:predicted AlkP superfamily phosphohydrolase/phosphomutase